MPLQPREGEQAQKGIRPWHGGRQRSWRLGCAVAAHLISGWELHRLHLSGDDDGLRHLCEGHRRRRVCCKPLKAKARLPYFLFLRFYLSSRLTPAHQLLLVHAAVSPHRVENSSKTPGLGRFLPVTPRSSGPRRGGRAGETPHEHTRLAVAPAIRELIQFASAGYPVSGSPQA